MSTILSHPAPAINGPEHHTRTRYESHGLFGGKTNQLLMVDSRRRKRLNPRGSALGAGKQTYSQPLNHRSSNPATHFDQLWERPVSLDFFYFQPVEIPRFFETVGFEIEEISEHEPYAPELEHQS